MRKRIVSCQNTVAFTLQYKRVVRNEWIVEGKFIHINSRRLRVDLVDQFGIQSFNHLLTSAENIDIDNLVVDVIFHRNTQGTRFHAQVDVFGDKNGFHFRMFFRYIQNGR
ncbi:hypothetical protein SDC9_115260 [bioreactor metagenome]|uniref:Uncharacterized protein n=1 Tax=bioreactor metagenome TaxID=1076179 RepID=A0A645BTD1_9ZZZZ